MQLANATSKRVPLKIRLVLGRYVRYSNIYYDWLDTQTKFTIDKMKKNKLTSRKKEQLTTYELEDDISRTANNNVVDF